MRLSHSMLFDSFVSYLNQTTSYLQQLYEKAAYQKKIIRPSDNPAAKSKILQYKDSINAIDQYQKNIDSAQGWLGLTDDTLNQVQNILTRLTELAVQASNGSLIDKDRKTIAQEVKQLFDQLLALSNTTYEDKSIFAGHKLSSPAYEKGMAVFSNKRFVIRTHDGEVWTLKEEDLGELLEGDTEEVEEENRLRELGLDGARVVDPVFAFVKSVQGFSNSVIKVEFFKSDSPDGRATIGISDNITYKYTSLDGSISGSGTLNAGDTTLNLGGVTLELRKGLEVVVDSSKANEERTILYLAPTAIYKGDDNNRDGVEVKSNLNVRVDVVDGSFSNNVLVKIVNDSPVEIGDGNEIEYQYSTDGGLTWSDTLYAENTDSDKATLELPGGNVELRWVDPTAANKDISSLQFEIKGIRVEQSSTDLHAVAYGDIEKDIIVRIDEDVNLASVSSFQYSYSTDGGNSWVTNNFSSKGADGYFHLSVPGGVLKIAAAGQNNSISQGSLFTIKPRRADLLSEVTQNHFVRINQVGKDIFGGFYENSAGLEPVFENNEKKNLFITISRLIIALESNDQEGVSNCLSYLKDAQEVISKWQTDVGARENRIKTAKEILSDLKVNQQERRSYLEDVDFVKLITEISKTQTIYQSILKSASMIMRISLVNYI